MKEYKARIADKILAEKLDAMGAVLIEGPKYCGKTTLASQQAKSILSMSDQILWSRTLLWPIPISNCCFGVKRHD